MKDVLDLELQMFLRNLLPEEHEVLQEMRSYAEEHHIPVVDPEVGHLLHILTGLVQPERILEKELSIDKVTLIKCGGTDRIVSEREQWNDGANTLCIAPGTVVVYDRNYVTNRLLEDSGVKVLKFNGSELSRGRGGPRCMSMPFQRLPL